MVVVLPAPLGPMNPKIWPCSTWIDSDRRPTTGRRKNPLRYVLARSWVSMAYVTSAPFSSRSADTSTVRRVPLRIRRLRRRREPRPDAADAPLVREEPRLVHEMPAILHVEPEVVVA